MGTNLVEERKLGINSATTASLHGISQKSRHLTIFQSFFIDAPLAIAWSGDVGRWLIFYRPSWGLIMGEGEFAKLTLDSPPQQLSCSSVLASKLFDLVKMYMA